MATTTSDKKATNGSRAKAADEIVVENPATGQVVATLPAATPADVAAMAERARRAQPAWNELGFAERGKVLLRFQKWMCDNADRIIDTEMSESGKTLSYASSSSAKAATAYPNSLSSKGGSNRWAEWTVASPSSPEPARARGGRTLSG